MILFHKIPHVSTVKECNYRSVALASISSTRCTYVHVLVQRYSELREYRLAREEQRRQAGSRAGSAVTQKQPTRVDYM